MRAGAWGKRAGTAVLAAAMIPALAGVTGAVGAAGAWGPGTSTKPPKGFKSEKVDGAGMPAVTVRSWASTTTAPSKAPTVVLLDGLRATQDVSGWERDTNVAFLSQQGINVVMPVGGRGSFYTNWKGVSNNLNGTYRPTWGSFLASSLPSYIGKRGFSSNVTLVGVSMSGSSALINAVNNRGFYKKAASLSGTLTPSAPGMPIAIGIAMQDAGGYNAVNMWGLPTDRAWSDNDPAKQVSRFKGLPLWISAATGNPGGKQLSPAEFVQGVPLEMLANSTTQSFKDAADKAGVSAHYDLSGNGVHSWPQWQAQVWKMKSSGFFG